MVSFKYWTLTASNPQQLSLKPNIGAVMDVIVTTAL